MHYAVVNMYMHILQITEIPVENTLTKNGHKNGQKWSQKWPKLVPKIVKMILRNTNGKTLKIIKIGKFEDDHPQKNKTTSLKNA